MLATKHESLLTRRLRQMGRIRILGLITMLGWGCSMAAPGQNHPIVVRPLAEAGVLSRQSAVTPPDPRYQILGVLQKSLTDYGITNASSLHVEDLKVQAL